MSIPKTEINIPKADIIKEEILIKRNERTSSFRDEIIKKINEMSNKEKYSFSITLPKGIDRNNKVIKELRLAGYSVEVIEDTRDYTQSLTVWIEE